MMKTFTPKPIFIALAITLSACTATEVDLTGKVNLPPRFEQVPQRETNAEIAQWWKNWRDPQLTALIEQGLRHNPDISIAKARLQEAQANSRYTNADLGPSVGAQGNAGLIHSHTQNPFSGQTADHSGNMQIGALTAKWELDFFGKKQSDADAAQAIALSAQDQVYAAQMLVAAQIAENYADIFALQQQSKVLKQSENTLKQLKHYIQGRFNAGQANANDVSETESRINAIQAQLSVIDSRIAAHERAIAVLTGNTPQGFRINKSAVDFFNVLPPPPNGIMPSDLLARRPDLRAYRNQVQAATAKLASAKAELYPRFDIQFIGQSGRIELNTDSPDLKSWAGLFSAGISLPIFTNGRIQAGIDAADARLQNALLQYDKALLQALADVDNSYQAQYALQRQKQLLHNASAQATTQAANADKLFKYGEKTLDSALTARLTALDYQQQLIQSKLNGSKNLINLYKALGGGWQE